MDESFTCLRQKINEILSYNIVYFVPVEFPSTFVFFLLQEYLHDMLVNNSHHELEESPEVSCFEKANTI